MIYKTHIERVTSELLKPFNPVRDENGKTLHHAAWMMDNLPEEQDKRDRWVGYAQCLLVMHGVVSLDQMRDATRPRDHGKEELDALERAYGA